jgi:hypothetical protein
MSMHNIQYNYSTVQVGMAWMEWWMPWLLWQYIHRDALVTTIDTIDYVHGIGNMPTHVLILVFWSSLSCSHALLS